VLPRLLPEVAVTQTDLEALEISFDDLTVAAIESNAVEPTAAR
jgi:hypothetical protein